MRKKILLLLISFLVIVPFIFSPRNHHASINSDNELNYFNRALSKINKDPEGAILDFTKALSLNPKDPNAYTNRGILKRLMKDNAGAISDFPHAIALNPSDVKAYLNRGLAKRSLNDNAGAALDLKRAKSLLVEQRKTNSTVGLVVLDWLQIYKKS